MTRPKKKLFLVLILIAALCIGIGSGILISHRHASADAGQGVTLDTNAVDYSDKTSQESVAKYIRFPGYSDITLKSTDTSIPIVLTNPDVNPCYFSFTITLDDTSDALLQSDWVAPGKALEGVTLSQPLTTGDHTLHIQIRTKSLDTEEPMNGGNVEVPLHVG